MSPRSTMLTWICCGLAVPQRVSARFIDLDRWSAADLSLEEFEARYLNKAPVVISGISICPDSVQLDNLGDYCSGTWQIMVETEGGENDWAGLQAKNAIPARTFIAQMSSVPDNKRKKKRKRPRYAFDVNMYQHCAQLPQWMFVPGHASKVLMNQWAGHWSQCQLPNMNLYLAERGMRTNLHVDDHHTNFVASMCQGQKVWRIMKPGDWASQWKRLGTSYPSPGITTADGKFILGDLPRPFETWTDSSKLLSLGIDIFEGILGPGEMLYIPAGAPHAAHTLNNSFMVAVNDFSFQEGKDFIKACKTVRSQKSARLEYTKTQCKDLTPIRKEILKQASANWAQHGVNTSTKTWIDAFRCKDYCEVVKAHTAKTTPSIMDSFSCKGGKLIPRQHREL
eukprot:TRINITY_DN111778_c0_g1_i1.p1 TRINITY_DN111778_c0_g1~~TRINITY_DN111778_c0_g1_i1.p1  ORF type:complete len:395 (-),score=40.44 TRINITY_DN111778_c0_g1_i1:102-1286(-)